MLIIFTLRPFFYFKSYLLGILLLGFFLPLSLFAQETIPTPFITQPIQTPASSRINMDSNPTPSIGNQTINVKEPISNNWWIKATIGYDYAFLGDITTSIKNIQNYAQALNVLNGNNIHQASSQTGNSGLVAGLEVGTNLDGENTLSLKVENIWTQNMGWTYANVNAPPAFNFNIYPDLESLTINFEHILFDPSWGKTFLTVGGGYYQAEIGMTVFNGTNPAGNGTFTGNNLGGTLGIDQTVNLNNSFNLEFTINGRLATINQVTAQNLNEASGVVSGPFYLAVLNINVSRGLSSNTDFLHWVSQSSMNQNPTYYRYAVVDYSGISGDIGLNLSF